MSDFHDGEVLEWHRAPAGSACRPISEVTFVEERRGWCFVFDGLEPKLIRQESLKRPTFSPGLFRRKIQPASFGYDVMWFDRNPGESWERIS